MLTLIILLLFVLIFPRIAGVFAIFLFFILFSGIITVSIVLGLCYITILEKWKQITTRYLK